MLAKIWRDEEGQAWSIYDMVLPPIWEAEILRRKGWADQEVEEDLYPDGVFMNVARRPLITQARGVWTW